MKNLSIEKMDSIEGGWRTSVGCAIVGASMGIASGGLGFAAGLACSLYFEYNPK